MLFQPERAVCGCLFCVRERMAEAVYRGEVGLGKAIPGPKMKGWRNACPQCGNRNCPRYSNHTYCCTYSNKLGQEGSWFK